ncbi:MAG: FAD-binding oxidoreductase [Desulfobacula sp.]|uniref:NAD(P)/FAD-dependent oxidoreductase n=1 Tax=Desulfobacula sp. TaxID=2593537 RepID=UPI0025BF2C0E|nr:FAD-binding oxidoreductase [Desulfobacula sp.]MCD4722935.1 FAD-binding oxidoreductase [Desulfobacula sp.]
MENKNITHGLWAATAPSKPRLTSIQGDQRTDIAIIGGGYTGLSAALHLAKMGKESIVLEAEDIGYGGAGRNVGLVNAGLWLMPEDLIKLAGPEYGDRLIKVLGDSPDLVFKLIEEHQIECEALRNGTLHCADSKSGLKALQQREEQWLKYGAPVRLLGQDEAASKTGSNSFYGALLDKRAGTIQPLAYAYGLANAALKAGAQLYNQSPVVGFEKTRDGWKLNTPSGTLTANSVIIAVPAYPGHAFESNKKSMVRMNFFQFATQPLSKDILKIVLPERQGAWDTNLILSSYRLDAAGRLIVGSVGAVKGFAYGLHESWVKRTIAKTFPQVGNMQLEHGWYGTFAMTPKPIPRFHVPEKNMAMITSYNGRGIGPGTVFGKLLAEYISGGSPEDIPLPISKNEPVWSRLFWNPFYETGARLYHFVQRRI